MSREAELEKWDVRPIYSQVRERNFALIDRIRKLMVVESGLAAEVEQATERAEALTKQIGIVEGAGGSASDLRVKLAEVETVLDPKLGELLKLRDEMRLVRASMKWTEMAYDGLHWLCFTDSELRRFDETASAMSASGQDAEERLEAKPASAVRDSGDAP